MRQDLIEVGRVYATVSGRCRKVIGIFTRRGRLGDVEMVRYLSPHYRLNGEIRPPEAGLMRKEVTLRSFAHRSVREANDPEVVGLFRRK